MNYNTAYKICNSAQMKHPLESYIRGAYKSCQMQNQLNILIKIVQKYSMQQGITRMPIPIVPTEKGNLKYAYRQLQC